MAAGISFRMGAVSRLVLVLLVGCGVLVGAVILPGVAQADSGSFTFGCNIPGLGVVPYLDQAQGTIPSGLTAGQPFAVSGLKYTATTPVNFDAGDTISGSVTTTLTATGATPSSESVTLDITPFVVPNPPSSPTVTLTDATNPTFTATGGQVVISTGPAVSAFAISLNGVAQPPFSCSLESPPAAIAYSSPAGALVANGADNTVSVVDPATGTVDGTIPVGSDPSGIAITPDGQDAFVADAGSNAVSVIDTSSGNTLGAPIPVGNDPVAVAIAPSGHTAYVVNNGDGTVTPITVATRKASPAIVLSRPSGFGSNPSAIVITPDGSTAYVADGGSNEIHVLDLATATELAHPTVGFRPSGLVVSPDGSTVYVGSASNIDVISTATNTVTSSYSIGTFGVDYITALAMTPDGSTIYATYNSFAGSPETGDAVAVTTTGVVGTPVSLPDLPTAVSISPDGSTAEVTLAGSTNALAPVAVATGTVGTPVTVGSDPLAVAFQPDQAPVASLVVASAFPGDPSTFDASGSTSTTSAIASYTWNFGDGSPPQTTSTPVVNHVYATTGTYGASVTVTDNAGTSTQQTFTGQTVSNSGSNTATTSQLVVVVACSADQSCTATVSTPSGSSNVSGTSQTDGSLTVAIGPQFVSCGSGIPQSQTVTTYSTTTFTAASLQAVLTVPFLKTAKGFSVCYDSTEPFIDAQGDSVLSGKLPKCSADAQVPPCLVSAKEVHGSVVAVINVLPGDPRFWTQTALTVKSFAPLSAPVGGKVTVVGTGLSGTTAVLFGKARATFSVATNGKKVTVTVPAGTENGPITVIGPTATATSSASFSIAKPTIKPVKGSPGATVTIKGKNLTAVSQVAFSGQVATITKNTATSVTVTIPGQAGTGSVSVVTPGGTAVSTYTAT